MRDPAFDLVHGQGGAEFEDFDVPGFHERLELRKVHGAGAGGAMVAAGELDIMNVKAEEMVALGFQVKGMVNEAEVFLDLRVASVVPVNRRRTGEGPEELVVVGLQREFLD